MALYLDTTNRLIIPRWREYKSKFISPEHLPLIGSASIKNEFFNNPVIQDKIDDFETDKSINTAWELVNTAYVINQYDIANEAAQFLKSNLTDIPYSLKKIVYDILGIKDEEYYENEAVSENISSLKRAIGAKIKKVKIRLTRYIRNELLWIELARLYLILGKSKKAEKCVLVATGLSNGANRFITRAASRFFYHIGDVERAQQLIRKSPFLKLDPWLLSTEISYSSKQNKTSRFTKQGFSLINSNNYSNASISELASTLGTLELKNGDYRGARKLTTKSLIAPNDNSLAQAEWISRSVSDIIIDPWLNTTELAFEARANEFRHKGYYKKALKEGLDWIIDQPFSKRPILFVSYLCLALTNDLDMAIEVGALGMLSNPTAFPVINNLVFAYAAKGDLPNAKKYVDKLRSTANGDDEQCVARATEGFVSYKLKDYEKGRVQYQAALDFGLKKDELKELRAVAEGYWTREQFIADELTFEEAMTKLKKLSNKEKDSDAAFRIALLIGSLESIEKARHHVV